MGTDRKEYMREYRKKNAVRIAEQEKRYVAEHLEQRRAISRKSHAKNKAKYIATIRAYYENHKAAIRARINEWFQEHPEKNQLHHQKRRFSKASRSGTFTHQEWKEIKEKYGNKCLCCGRSDVKLTIDHVVPFSLGGTHTADNIQPLCQRCNSKKSTKNIDYRG
jgi:5-methylcytosine-specific restriction endonuclease McrA